MCTTVATTLPRVEERRAGKLGATPTCGDKAVESPATVTTGVPNWFWRRVKTETGLQGRAGGDNTICGNFGGGTLALHWSAASPSPPSRRTVLFLVFQELTNYSGKGNEL